MRRRVGSCNAEMVRSISASGSSPTLEAYPQPMLIVPMWTATRETLHTAPREGSRMTDTSPSPLSVEICPDGSILLKGELDMATAKQVEDAIAEIMRPGRPVVIDMAQVSFIDSSGVRLLARTHQQTGERVVIWNPSRWVWSVLEIIDAKAKPEAWVMHAD